MPIKVIEPICIGCNKPPEEIPEYIAMGRAEGMTPTEFVLDEEPIGVWGKGPNKFYCTDCYIKAGQPSRRS